DCYRLKSLQEAYDIGAEEYIYSGCYCFVEWPELIVDLLPDATIHVQIQIIDKDKRLVRMDFR
nr:tRNA (adenosine(37)-N6)-threonylcarbamoyltransferase complex ATPase subunit type 1 TsaE [Prolixibacteraceae bacterium]